MRYFRPLFTAMVVLFMCLIFLPHGSNVHAASATTCPGWHIVSNPTVSSEANLRGVAHIPANDIWAVGAEPVQGSSAQPIALHWNGSAWHLVSIPSPSALPTGLAGVAAISSNDGWATGSYVDAATRNTLTLTEHWNGTKWSIVPSPNPSTMENNAIEDNLYSVVAIATNNVWAAGASDGIYNPLVEHWNGSKWNVVASPNPAPDHLNSEFLAIGGTAANNLWAVGDQSNGHFGVSLIEHWNGSTWSVVPNPATSFPSWNGLNSVTATSTSDAWAVGYYLGSKADQTLIEHWDGSKWRIVSSPNVSTSSRTLYSVVATSSTDAWAVGAVSGYNYPVLIEHWNGTSWSIVVNLANQTVGGIAYAATLVSGKLWVVGEDYTSTSQVLIGYYCS